MTNKKSNCFRLIAIRPLVKCSKNIRKVLKENKLYIFYHDYIESRECGLVRNENKGDSLKGFYTQGPVNLDFNVNISAIVGRNGDGKSSLVELFMRVMNNFAYLSGFKSCHEELYFANNVYAELYYEIESESDEVSLYLIESKGNVVAWYKIVNNKKELICKWEDAHTSANLNNLDNIKIHEHLLFYTQIINYSMHSYNVSDFENECYRDESCWLNGIFHKNDGYQTPIVIIPFRERGVIDINKENSLAKARLLELFLNDCQYEDDNKSHSYRKIDDKLYAQALELKSKKVAKEDSYVLEYFQKTAGDDISRGLIADIKGTTRDITSKSNSFIFDVTLQMYNLLIRNKYLNKFNRIDSWCAIMKKYTSQDKDLNKYKGYSEFRALISSINDFYSSVEKNDVNNKKNIDKYQKMIYELMDSDLIDFNFNQLNKLALANYCDDKWREILQETDLSKELENKLISYLVYKTLSIIDLYPEFRSYRKEYFSYHDFLKKGDISVSQKEYFDSAFKIILDDIMIYKTHISLKLRRTLTFMYVNECRNLVEITDEDGFMLPLELYYNKVKDMIGRSLPLGKINLSELALQELLPPPIFSFDIKFKIDNTENLTTLSGLSTGQRQLLYFSSSIIYHLKNINSVKIKDNNKNKVVKYSHINLFFEEIELYFHPDFQRNIVYYLLMSLSKVVLSDIKSINICFSTHSPFILSDIPKNNILVLMNGDTVSPRMNTFGANIIELLSSAFFLDKVLIGEFAHKRIGDIIHWLNSDSYENAHFYKNMINIIDEPIVKRKLAEMYDEKMKENEDALYLEVIEKQISDLLQLKEKMQKK